MFGRQPSQPERSKITDPDLSDAVEAYSQMKEAKLIRELRLQKEQLELEIQKRDADSDRRIREAKALSGLPLAVLAFIATDHNQQSVLLEFEKWMRAEGLSPGQLVALTAQGPAGQETLAKYTESLYKGLAQVMQAAPAGGVPPELSALLERLAKEGM